MKIIKEKIVSGERVYEISKGKSEDEILELFNLKKSIDKYNFANVLILQIDKKYIKLAKSISEDRGNRENTIDSLTQFLIAFKKYEDIIRSKISEEFSDGTQWIEPILEKIHSHKEYNLIYNIRNYEEHIGMDMLKTQETATKFVISVNTVKLNELKSTRWSRKVKEQFEGYQYVEINEYIMKAYNILNLFNKEVYKFILEHDDDLYDRCLKLFQFYREFGKEDEKYKIYFSNISLEELVDGKSNEFNLNQLDEKFIHYLLLQKPVYTTVLDGIVDSNEIITDENGIKYLTIQSTQMYDEKKSKVILVPNCLSYNEIEQLSKQISLQGIE